MISVNVCKEIEADVEVGIYKVQDREGTEVEVDEAFSDSDGDLTIILDTLFLSDNYKAMLTWLNQHGLHNVSDLESKLRSHDVTSD